jgi:hypothetical protein
MKTFVRLTMLSVAVCGFLTSAAHTAHGQGDVVLQAHLTGDDAAEGKVHYQMKEKLFRTFQAHLVGLEPGEVIIVVLRREKEVFKFAWVRANKQGVGELFLSTAKGQRIPFLQMKDVVEIHSIKGMIMVGQLY